ncbi:MAG TPA: fumarate hydratase [Thermodesulfovibrio thiophilus]|uniref:fumarate hydratase n=1 Tax=Thermodesulfovibrio thiophilus TaxID=340095 RepID=UPI001855F3AF|nr:fumarate hydratase [Thermodesulfovibrio thiophilus]HHW19977.1 fumarate hydratase [Thermodesulfovibrio thiophilus]HOA83803.1 fumarate hydratase [Thermodesulfovibrio thiophilus]HQA04484.1 fumarate hydratase [Thermodesulfovibrio thiophilus]HQD36891.1 fumarate hydratase [Thermodesulfovibrio thiophilus]
MKKITRQKIIETVKKLYMDAAVYLQEDVLMVLTNAYEKELGLAKELLRQIIENQKIAASEKLPLCQDTGIAVIFVEWGTEVIYEDGQPVEAFNEGVRQAVKEGYLRASVVDDPVFERKNTKDNTPCIIHFELTKGDKVKITLAPKGAGSENMSALRMLKPAEGLNGVKAFVIETVRKAGGNPCPPIIVGVGIGGSFEKSAILAKKAILRKVGEPSKHPQYAQLERELVKEINELGIGSMGVGGNITALAVHIEYYPCHIASLPVAVNIQCHSARHMEAEI